MLIPNSRFLSSLILTLTFMNAVLISIVFYLLVPLISPSANIKNAPKFADEIMQTIGPDATIFWQVNLETNSRMALVGRAKNVADAAAVNVYITLAQRMSFTAAISPSTFQALLSGNSLCYKTSGVSIMAISALSKLNAEFPDSVSCIVPNKNSNGILNGYVIQIWKRSLSVDEQNSVIIQTQNILTRK